MFCQPVKSVEGIGWHPLDRGRLAARFIVNESARQSCRWRYLAGRCIFHGQCVIMLELVDEAAKRAGKTVLGTGVNPGFLMDVLPLFLTAICQQVDKIEVTRIINASVRRGPFQAKIGSGMTVEAFEAKMAEGRMGHVGLPESVGDGGILIEDYANVEPWVEAIEALDDDPEALEALNVLVQRHGLRTLTATTLAEAAAMLEELRRIGVSIALDDFGSGLSSSAAFGNLLGGVFNALFNRTAITAIELARFAKQVHAKGVREIPARISA